MKIIELMDVFGLSWLLLSGAQLWLSLSGVIWLNDLQTAGIILTSALSGCYIAVRTHRVFHDGKLLREKTREEIRGKKIENDKNEHH